MYASVLCASHAGLECHRPLQPSDVRTRSCERALCIAAVGRVTERTFVAAAAAIAFREAKRRLQIDVGFDGIRTASYLVHGALRYEVPHRDRQALRSFGMALHSQVCAFAGLRDPL